MKSRPLSPRPPTLPKTPTGITGLDEITGGGLPSGRPTLVSGLFAGLPNHALLRDRAKD